MFKSALLIALALAPMIVEASPFAEPGCYRAVGRLKEWNGKAYLLVLEGSYSQVQLSLDSGGRNLADFYGLEVVAGLEIKENVADYRGEAVLLGIRHSVPNYLARNRGQGLRREKNLPCR